MNLHLSVSKLKTQNAELKITGSKSETNRLLLLQALFPELTLENASNSDDSEVMLNALAISQHPTPSIQTIDVHHAGTAMRFLTAFFAIQENKEFVLTGSDRMKERPIQLLVDALNDLGADISFLEKEGFPPLKIKGKKIIKSKVALPANVSSQYISALLLIAPKLENGLELTLEGEITSMPYIKMTLALLNQIGVEATFMENFIKISPLSVIPPSGVRGLVESDWSSASYWYSFIALSSIGTQISLASFKKNSLQGDSILVELYQNFGVETTFNAETITLRKVKNLKPVNLKLKLNNSPDIAQTIAVTCFALGITCELTGLHTLKIKETDRLHALQVELTKLGANVLTTEEAIHIQSNKEWSKKGCISTYNDHRMAMAFAPLALKVPITIENAEVVSKSYPHFWEDVKRFGIKIS